MRAKAASWRVAGFRAAGVCAGIKPSGAPDVALIVSDRPAAVAGMLTRSRFPGAPVELCRRRLRRGAARGVVVNSGISNVAMGARGRRDAEEMAALAAGAVGARPADLLVCSTGVIGRPLPMEALRAGIPDAARALAPDGWKRAARAILTTDLRPKLARAGGRGFSLVGIAKGSGMAMPRMATVLVFLATDLAVAPAFLRDALREAADPTLNAFTIDGETSTSDTLLLFANGAAGNRPLGARSARAPELRAALADVCGSLAEQLARDGEGVTRLADVIVTGARSARDADRAARSVANSALFKTALFGADPNWGRIVQALGKSGAALRPERVGIRIGGVELLRRGEPAGGERALARAEAAMRRPRVAVEVSLGLGRGEARILTTDLTYDYVRINAEYTT